MEQDELVVVAFVKIKRRLEFVLEFVFRFLFVEIGRSWISGVDGVWLDKILFCAMEIVVLSSIFKGFLFHFCTGVE